MTSNQSSRSGWFPDPSGAHQFRYFDVAWTDQVSDNGIAMTSPLVPPPRQEGAFPQYVAPPQPVVSFGSPGPRSKRKWIIGTAAVLALIVVVSIIAAAHDSKSNGGRSVSISRYCSDLNAKFDNLSVPGTLLYASTGGPIGDTALLARVHAAISNVTTLAAEAPAARLTTDMTAIAARPEGGPESYRLEPG